MPWGHHWWKAGDLFCPQAYPQDLRAKTQPGCKPLDHAKDVVGVALNVA